MTDTDLIVKADYVLPMDKDLSIIREGAVAVKDGKILAVGEAADLCDKYSTDRIVGGPGKLLMPGLVNTHTHSPMVFFRGLADDKPLRVWLEDFIWPAEKTWLSPQFVSDASELACLEMLKAGITLFNDMYFFGHEIATTAAKMGIRAVVGAGIVDFPTNTASTVDEYLMNAGALIERWKGDEYITPCVAPHSAYACGPETLKKARQLAEKSDVPLQIHLSETEWEVGEILSRYGKRPVHHLADLGLLGNRLTAAHCVWVDEEEIDLLAEKKVNVSHCMESNLKLASGFAPVASMLARGVLVSLGTDGAASNNDLNLLSEMSTTAKVHKALSGDPTVLDARTMVRMATSAGAAGLGKGDVTGSLETGKAADMIVADLAKPHMTPLYDPYSHVVYSLSSSDIETVVVNGRVVVDQGRLTGADESEIITKGVEWGRRIGAVKRMPSKG